MNAYHSTFEQQLETDGRLVYRNVGDSMRPMIREGRDVLVIVRPQGRLNKYDIPLYKRNGSYILHRAVKVTDDGYVICGDNRAYKEYGVTDGDIIGVLGSLVRDGKEYPVDSGKFRLYARVWCALFPLRSFVLRTKGFIKRKFFKK
ncbi:MAG: S24/S26 family peptidase [Clostridia bacterium]|nr:S24/S26 family peptidase [Clostridia bacterium]